VRLAQHAAAFRDQSQVLIQLKILLWREDCADGSISRLNESSQRRAIACGQLASATGRAHDRRKGGLSRRPIVPDRRALLLRKSDSL
jgi:hypothetical protein